MKTTFIYALCEPGTRTVRYIGKADVPEKRLQRHLKTKVKTPLGYWIRSLLAGGGRPNLVILHVVSENEIWQDEERRYIKSARTLGMRLVNSTEGGEGVTMSGEANPAFGKPSPFRGVPRTPETRARISASKIGVPKSPEHRANLSAATIGEKHHMFGRTLSPEVCEKYSLAKRGEKNPMFGKTHTPESNAKRSASLKIAGARRKEQDQEIEWVLALYALS